jgi:N-acetylmuramoyl-L-alanine amidase
MANLTDADLYLSIHSNAGRGKGFEVFTSEGQTKSDMWADRFIKQLKKDFPEWGMRTDTTDGDEDKEENFFVLKNTKMPAVLLELLFFDEESQALFLESEIGQNRIVESLNKAI